MVANQNNTVNGKIPSPSREQLAPWMIIDAAQHLSEETIKKSWSSNPGYEYFPGDILEINNLMHKTLNRTIIFLQKGIET